MNRDKLDVIIKDSLNEETREIKMSPALRDSILNNTIRKRKIPFEKFKRLMNTTIEIPLPSALAACLVVFFVTFSAFTVTEGMKKDKSILGYTSVKSIKVGGLDVYMEYGKNGGALNEKN